MVSSSLENPVTFFPEMIELPVSSFAPSRPAGPWHTAEMTFPAALNAPSSLQMTSAANVIDQDHADVIGVGPDTFDEMEFYAALIDYIAYYD